MNLASLKSLEPCGHDRIKNLMADAQQEIEIYVDGIDPHSFSHLNLAPNLTVYLITSGKIMNKAGEAFTQFFQQVLYESMAIDVDAKSFWRLRVGRGGCKFITGICTLILIFFPLTVLMRSSLFFMISLTTWILYQTYKYKVDMEVTQIKRRTHFKILDDLELAYLPALYIIDDEKTFIGGNLFQGEPGPLYEVVSFEEQVALKLVYRNYSQSQAAVEEETLIAKYLQQVGMNQDDICFP